MNNKKIIMYEPKITNRFIVDYFENIDLSTHTCYYAQRPSLSVKNNDNKLSWDDIEFKFYDFISPSMSQNIFKRFDFLLQNNSSNVKISILDPVGNTVEQWNLEGKILKLNLGKLSWNENEHLGITIIYKILKCKLIY